MPPPYGSGGTIIMLLNNFNQVSCQSVLCELYVGLKITCTEYACIVTRWIDGASNGKTKYRLISSSYFPNLETPCANCVCTMFFVVVDKNTTRQRTHLLAGCRVSTLSCRQLQTTGTAVSRQAKPPPSRFSASDQLLLRLLTSTRFVDV